MGMPARKQQSSPRRWTVEDVRALIDETQHTPRYELIDGELLVSFPTDERGVTSAPSWTHQEAVSQLLQALAAYLAHQPVGHVLMAPADVELEPASLVQPDVFVLPLAPGEPFSAWHSGRGLLLAMEVLSPTPASSSGGARATSARSCSTRC